MSENDTNNQPTEQPSGGMAVASLVLGILSLICVLLVPPLGLVLGIVGVVCASVAKKNGYRGGMMTGGLVCSIIGVAINGALFVACAACAGILGGAGALTK